ncbi:MAG: SpoIIE family protein phosphatase [Oscillospiraceae bacterium]|nr:SpoIIE family protein phosphatase [Oscillospiraceae bacterium]
MLTAMETCMRITQRRIHKFALEPRVQSVMRVTAYGGSGFLLSAAALCGVFQPLALGLICSQTGWRAAVTALGAMAGYRLFWGKAGLQGVVWSGLGCLLALLLGKGKQAQAQPLLLPALSGVVTAAAGTAFLLLRQSAAFPVFFLRVCLAPVSTWFFHRAGLRRENVTGWILGGIAVLALARVGPLGYAAGGVLALWASFPAAALGALGLELAGVTQLPMSVVICAAWFGRMLPFQQRWMRCAVPAAACIGVMILSGIWDAAPLPGLALGGLVAHFLPPRVDSIQRRGETGIAQVRLELTAAVMAQIQQLLLETELPRIDEEALLNRAINRSCGNCPSRENCIERASLSMESLHNPLGFACRRPWEIQGELLRARERLRDLKADRQRQQEYRSALVQQYRFLSVYLRQLSDQLPRRGERPAAYYRLEVSARSRGKERANGDRCLAFPGTGCRYYVLLCDGMGTGLGAAQEGQSAGELLKKMLSAGFPPEHALRSLNSILALRGQAGAVTLDLAEIRLDSGRISLYKWGAAPSYFLGKTEIKKIGTAAPPPGISIGENRETVDRLSLRRGEMLILVSDGAEIGEVLRRRKEGAMPPGEMAEWLLEESQGAGEDDATVAVLRLHRHQLST